MRDLVILFVHLIATLARLLGPGSLRSVVAESVLARQQLLTSDHDPLFRFHQWQANLRILEVTEIKAVPYVPLSHPFVERHDSPRVPGPHIVLHEGRPGVEAA